MRKMKYVILLLLLFLIIGFATISISLSITGSANVLSDVGDFKVYFSNVKENGVQNLKLVKSEKELVFNVNLSGLGSSYTFSYDVTNDSSVFDANVDVSCTQGDELLSIINEFDNSKLFAKSTRTGTLTLKKMKPNESYTDTKYSISCNITASAISRDSEAIGDVIGPLHAYKYLIGNEIVIDTEKFNIIEDNGDVVTLLAQYNLGADYKQSATSKTMHFGSDVDWSYEVDGMEIDITTGTSNVGKYVKNYVDYLTPLTGDFNLVGDLITISKLNELGCTFNNDYTLGSIDNMNCNNSQNLSWIANGQGWWTKSVNSKNLSDIFYITETGYGNSNCYDCYSRGVRPIITVSKEALENDLILFTIQNKTYQSLANMTWYEWINSKYNTGDYSINNEDNTIISSSGLSIYNVTKTDTIVKNKEYNHLISFTIDVYSDSNSSFFNEVYYAYEGMTWGDWVHSDFNVGEYNSDYGSNGEVCNYLMCYGVYVDELIENGMIIRRYFPL